MTQTHEALQQIADSAAKKLGNLQLRVEHTLLDQPFVYSTGNPNQLFHSASAGKLATSMAIAKAIESSLLDWSTKASSVLPKGRLDGLFVSHQQDHQEDVTIAHLLGHTSGVKDYFEGKSKGQKPLVDRAIRDRTHRFTVDEMIDFTKHHQTPVGIPGQKFYYSDTGYLLLGKIAEAVWKRPLHQVFRDVIFDPLGMKDTGLCFYDPAFDATMLAPVVVKGVELSQAESLSVDWAGGGLFTTTSDLAKFLKGIVSGRLIEPSTLQKMAVFEHPFRAGMVYGLGLMEMQFEKLFFLLKGLPRLIGHTGILGVHAWIDPLTMDVYVINVGDASKISVSFQLLIQLIMTVRKPAKGPRS